MDNFKQRVYARALQNLKKTDARWKMHLALVHPDRQMDPPEMGYSICDDASFCSICRLWLESPPGTDELGLDKAPLSVDDETWDDPFRYLHDDAALVAVIEKRT